jgi:hypothetical protein
MITDTRPLDSMWPMWYDEGRGTKTEEEESMAESIAQTVNPEEEPVPHQHTPCPDVSQARTVGNEVLTHCKDCDRMIHAPLFQSGIHGVDWRERVPRKRYARILVLTESDYLTANGEETEESGWDEVATNLAGCLQGFNRFKPFARFIEWEEE